MRGLPAVGLPLSVSVLDRIPESRRGRPPLAGRGDNPALPRRLRVVFASLRGRIRAVALEHIPGRNRVQAPAAPGFYWSCADALTEGLSPQSGLVQRECFMLPAAVPPLVAGATFLPIQGALWVLGSGVNLSLWQQQRENHTTGLRSEENKPITLAGAGNAPLLRLRRRLPRRGRFALHSAFELISISRHSAAKTSPSGGSGAIAPKGGAPGMGVI